MAENTYPLHMECLDLATIPLHISSSSSARADQWIWSPWWCHVSGYCWCRTCMGRSRSGDLDRMRMDGGFIWVVVFDTVDGSEIRRSPAGMVLKPVVNNGISTTNLNWFAGFQPSTVFFYVHPENWGKNQLWLILFKWVETSKQLVMIFDVIFVWSEDMANNHCACPTVGVGLINQWK